MQNKYFLNDAAEFVYTRTYAKWREQDNRREIWPETIQRYIDFIQEERGEVIPSKVIKKMKNAISV
jgi:hypothetical protein